MRVAIDARQLGQGRGIARYLEEMLTALVAGFPDDEWVAVVPGDREVSVPSGIELRRTRLSSKPLFAAAALTGRPRLEKLARGADVTWLPAPAPVACGRRTPYVLTVHDLSFELRPEDFTAYERRWLKAARPRRLAQRSARIVVDSEATATDLIEAGWEVDAAKLTVIRAAPSAALLGAQAEGAESGRGYLLYVGALEPRKGLDTLAEATTIARRSGLTAPLLVVGEGRLASEIEAVAGVRLLGRQSDEQLAQLYSGALALVMPSRLEGFGLPPVEAAAHAVPSVISDLPVFRETLGDAALTFPVGDAEALAKALVLISGDSALRARVGEEARLAVDNLSWTSAASSLRAVLSEAAGEAQ
jgi:glycosyltransferase involved in cell wall biosynthesis